MNRIIFNILVLVNITALFASGQELPAEKGLASITHDVIMAQLGFLSSDWTEGRETGERGEYLAADYIASMLQLYGIKPDGDIIVSGQAVKNTGDSEKSYFQKITLLKRSPGGDPVFISKTRIGDFTRSITFSDNIDYSVRSFSGSIETEAPLIFAGYGIKSAKSRNNDVIKADINGKFIMLLSGCPEYLQDKLTFGEITSSKREFDDMIKNMGAAGVIEVDINADVASNAGVTMDFLNMSPSERTRRTGQAASYSLPGQSKSDDLPRIRITLKTANEIFNDAGFSVKDYLKKTETGYPVPLPAISGISIYLKTSVNTTAVPVRNILGKIEGKNPDEIIVIGAHYDHVGMSNGYIWNGADDNASGTVGVMTIARALMATGEKPEKTIVIALWAAEEKGLLGSKYYVENLPYPRKNLRLNINFDMISRYISDDEPKKVTMTYSEAFPIFREVTENNLNKYNIDLEVDYQPSKNPPGGSDHRSFVDAGIPVLRFKPGHRSEYHTPFDEIQTINPDIMEKIIKISFLNTWDLVNIKWQDIFGSQAP
jgi:hypothetical protein